MADKILIRRDTAANWITAAPTLLDGEYGYETDSTRFKIGDGSTAWASLPYVHPAVSMVSLTLISKSHITNGNIVLEFVAATKDTDNYFDVGASTSRINAPFTGLYHIEWNAYYSSSTSQFFFRTAINLERGGDTLMFNDFPQSRFDRAHEPVSSATASAKSMCFLPLTAGQYIEIIVFQFGATRSTVVSPQGGLVMRFIGA